MLVLRVVVSHRVPMTLSLIDKHEWMLPIIDSKIMRLDGWKKVDDPNILQRAPFDQTACYHWSSCEPRGTHGIVSYRKMWTKATHRRFEYVEICQMEKCSAAQYSAASNLWSSDRLALQYVCCNNLLTESLRNLLIIIYFIFDIKTCFLNMIH